MRPKGRTHRNTSPGPALEAAKNTRMYLTIAETKRYPTMSTVAERTHAQNVTVPAKGFMVRGYDFDPHKLPEDERDFIFRSLFPIGLDAFIQEPSEAMENDIKEHLFSADHLLVMRADGSFSFGPCGIGQPRPIAFRMWKTYDTPIGKALYLAGMCIKPSWQGKGIGQEMTKYALQSDKYDFVFTCTQNPVAKLSLDRAIGYESYPRIEDAGQYYRYLNAGHVLAETLGKTQKYREETGILTGNYGGPLYGIMPTSKDERYNALFGRLNRNAGDAYLLWAPLR